MIDIIYFAQVNFGGSDWMADRGYRYGQFVNQVWSGSFSLASSFVFSFLAFISLDFAYRIEELNSF